jgi:hypothetical protein
MPMSHISTWLLELFFTDASSRPEAVIFGFALFVSAQSFKQSTYDD